mmetsp:Transcript_3213/g.5924  ORF Transcript_3213/g.5924 Transcript_3213/m.5924 type:complete len:216 (-) Transcript_3213:445-1092(-)
MSICFVHSRIPMVRQHESHIFFILYSPASFFNFSSSSSTAGFDGADDDELLLLFVEESSLDPSNIPFILLSSSSTDEDASNMANCFSMLLSADPGKALPPMDPISADTSAAASSASTFSSIRVKASILVFPVIPPSISFTFCVDCAVLARATICSFFALLSIILASNVCIPSYSLSTALACVSICCCSPSAVSTCCCRRLSASRANASLPALSAN